jgi:hypothetical protein
MEFQKIVPIYNLAARKSINMGKIDSCAWTPGAISFSTLCDWMQFHKAATTSVHK